MDQLASIKRYTKQYVIAIRKKTRAWLKRYPYHNILLLLLLAPVGYLFPLLFPTVLAVALNQLSETLTVMPPFEWPYLLDWWPVVMWCALAIFSLIICGHLIQIRPEKPSGHPLTRKQAPQLFDLIRDFRAIRGQMGIHRVIVTDRFELDIIKTRTFILPVWSHNTLVIGLPLAQMMPPNVFRAMVARKLSQHSLLRNPLLHWLHQLNSAWQQYCHCFKGKLSPDYIILEGFYKLYSAVYNFLVEPVARLDGLSADRYTLKFVNDEDIVESIEYLFIAGMFIEKIFWPKLREFAYQNNRYDLKPFNTLFRYGHAHLAKLNVNSWLEKEMNNGNSPRWGVSSMRVRLDTLGHNEIYNLYIISDSAATLYFGDTLPEIIQAADNAWYQKTTPQWKKLDDRLRKERTLLDILAQKARSLDYTFTDLYQYAKSALLLGNVRALLTIAKMFFYTRITLTKKTGSVAVS